MFGGGVRVAGGLEDIRLFHVAPGLSGDPSAAFDEVLAPEVAERRVPDWFPDGGGLEASLPALTALCAALEDAPVWGAGAPVGHLRGLVRRALRDGRLVAVRMRAGSPAREEPAGDTPPPPSRATAARTWIAMPFTDEDLQAPCLNTRYVGRQDTDASSCSDAGFSWYLWHELPKITKRGGWIVERVTIKSHELYFEADPRQAVTTKDIAPIPVPKDEEKTFWRALKIEKKQQVPTRTTSVGAPIQEAADRTYVFTMKPGAYPPGTPYQGRIEVLTEATFFPGKSEPFPLSGSAVTTRAFGAITGATTTEPEIWKSGEGHRASVTLVVDWLLTDLGFTWPELLLAGVFRSDLAEGARIGDIIVGGTMPVRNRIVTDGSSATTTGRVIVEGVVKGELGAQAGGDIVDGSSIGDMANTAEIESFDDIVVRDITLGSRKLGNRLVSEFSINSEVQFGDEPPAQTWEDFENQDYQASRAWMGVKWKRHTYQRNACGDHKESGVDDGFSAVLRNLDASWVPAVKED